MTFDPHRCVFCGANDRLQDLRPFGPGGAPACLACVTDPAHPEREEAAAALFEEAQRARAARRFGGATEVSPSVAEVRFGG